MKINSIFDFTNSEPSPFPSVGKVKNKGFEKLKNPILRHELERCNKTPYYSEKHLKIEDLGYKTLHQIDFLAKSRWIEYFSNGGKVYIQSRGNKLPLSSQILFDLSILNYFGKGIPMPKKVEPIKRGWVKGGKGGKADGFDFRIQSNDKLSKKNRTKLIVESERFINQIIEEQSMLGIERVDKLAIPLDSSNSDFELLEHWNSFYAKYGHRFSEFEEKWHKQFVRKVGNSEFEEIEESQKLDIKERLLSIKRLLRINDFQK
ncbi:MAG: hypothetical protein NTX34_07425 [Cytophagales bacterium]|nr:hypothetical protein [Cytophagales bacterium]